MFENLRTSFFSKWYLITRQLHDKTYMYVVKTRTEHFFTGKEMNYFMDMVINFMTYNSV